MNVGTAIKKLREEKGFTQRDMEKKTGLSQTHLSQIECNKKNASKKTLDKIAKALGIQQSLIYMMGIERKDIPKNRKPLYDQLFPAIESMILQITKMKE